MVFTRAPGRCRATTNSAGAANNSGWPLKTCHFSASPLILPSLTKIDAEEIMPNLDNLSSIDSFCSYPFALGSSICLRLP